MKVLSNGGLGNPLVRDTRGDGVSRRMALFGLTALGAYAPVNAKAWTHGLYFASNPYLNSIAVNFGSLTTAGSATRGGSVRLSAQDNFTDYGVNVYGLGLLTDGAQAPAFWTITATNSNNVWKFNNVNLASGVESAQVAEGVDALTPVPVTTLTNAATGPYTFTIKAYSIGGTLLASAPLTYNMVANAISLGSNDGFDNTSIPTGNFRNGTVTSPVMLLSTGFQRPTSYGLGSANISFASGHPVTVQWADSTKPGSVLNFAFNNMSNWNINGIVCTGNLTGGITSLLNIFNFSGASSNITLTNCGGVFTLATCNPTNVNNPSSATYAALNFGGCSNITVTGFTSTWLSSCMQDNQNTINSNITIGNSNGTSFGIKGRYFWNNASFWGNGSNISVYDTTFMSPMRIGGAHIDFWQASLGCNPQNLTAQRIFCVQADGNAQCQGVPFNDLCSVWTAFIDDGSGNGTYTGNPGQVLTITARVNGYSSNVTPTTAYWFQGDNFAGGLYQATGTASGGGGLYKLNLSIGSNIAVAAGNVYTAGMNNATFNGIVYVGYAGNALYLSGFSGTSAYKNFTHSKQNSPASNINYAQFYCNASTSSKTLTIVSAVSGYGPTFGPPMNVYLSPGYPSGTLVGQINTGGSYTGTAQLVSNATGNYTNTLMLGTEDAPITSTQGATLIIGSNDCAPIYAGTPSISSGFMWNGTAPSLVPINGGGSSWPSNAPSTLNSTSNVYFGNHGTASNYANCFVNNADPEAAAEAISTATWAGYTFEQVVAAYVTILTPKSGGPLDAGGGNWYGALTGAGQWNDGSNLVPQ